MRHDRATSGEAFQAMLLVVVAMTVVLGLAGWFVYSETTTALDRQLRSWITEDFGLVGDAYDRAGEQGMVEFIGWATATRAATSFAYGLFTEDGRALTGTISSLPNFEGWGIVETDATKSQGTQPILAYSAIIGDHVVVVGRSVEVAQVTGMAILQALAVAGLLIGAAALIIAFLFSRATSFKLRAMARTLEQVSHGNSDVRLPASPGNSQIDYVSRQINGYLDRLSELMATMRHTAIAIAHDLRSPINRVSILLQEAEQAKSAEAFQDYLRKAGEELDELLRSLDTILRISRIEASDDVSGFQPIALGPLLLDLVETYEPVMAAKGQIIRFIATAGDVQVSGDRRMLQQALVNLIENAGRYAGDGAVVEVITSRTNGAPTLSVSDNGPGIPAQYRAAALEPFFRLNPERDAMGTGLGLALVRAIATRHRAEIVLFDNGPGLRVSLVFPLRQDATRQH